MRLNDDDILSQESTSSERATLIRELRSILAKSSVHASMIACDLFSHPVFRDGAFTAPHEEVRACALRKATTALDVGAELGAHIFSFCEGRTGCVSGTGNDPVTPIQRLRDAINYLCDYSLDRGYEYQFALQAKPNPPNPQYATTTSCSYLGFIKDLDHPDMVGVNMDVGDERLCGMNALHAVAQAWDAGRLVHLELYDHIPGPFDFARRFGVTDPREAFWLVKFLEDVGYAGPRHFEVQVWRASTWDAVRDFVTTRMRNYLFLKERAAQWNEDERIRELLDELADDGHLLGPYSSHKHNLLQSRDLNHDLIASKVRPHEALEERTMQIILGTA